MLKLKPEPKKILRHLSVIVMVVGVLSCFSLAALAAEPCGDNCSSSGGPSGNTSSSSSSSSNNPADLSQSSPNCRDSSPAGVNKCLKTNQIVKDLNMIVNFLSAAVGVVIIAMIIVGGIQYSLAGDNSNATQAAKQRITNALIALAVFLFAFAFLQWLIPGGI